MANNRVILDQLYNRKRVRITPKDYLKRCRLYIMLHLMVIAIALFLLLSAIGVTFLSLGISGVIIASSIGLCYLFLKRTKSVAVKGDTLILNSINKQSCVTSLRSIKEVNTNTVLGLHLTRLDYKLDGVNRSTLVVNRSWAVPSTPEQLIKKAIQLSKRKKANHKPGSVLTQA